MSDNVPKTTRLRRTLGLWALVAYGVGDILGAGIYALVGKIAGIAGTASWLAFAVALVVAALTALSYAELGSRYPRSGGESYFCQRAFRSPALALIVGWIVFCSGVVSLATVSHAFVGYLFSFLDIPLSQLWYPAVLCVFLLAIGGINFYGIRQSSQANIVCTVVEMCGLLLVLVLGIVFLIRVPATSATAPPPADWPTVGMLGHAATVAFFAFIGFEDMVNVAEEVHSPRRTMPLAILLSLVIAGSIYIAVVWVATAVASPVDLADSDAPLLLVIQRAAPRFPSWLFTPIALFAVANTGLLNCIMASRLLYGMGKQQLVPVSLTYLHPRTETPIWAIVFVLTSAVALALSGTLVHLAGTTSALLLLVFFVVNASLLVVKVRHRSRRVPFAVPRALPALALLATGGLFCFVPPASFALAGAILGVGVALVVAHYVKRRWSVWFASERSD